MGGMAIKGCLSNITHEKVGGITRICREGGCIKHYLLHVIIRK